MIYSEKKLIDDVKKLTSSSECRGEEEKEKKEEKGKSRSRTKEICITSNQLLNRCDEDRKELQSFYGPKSDRPLSGSVKPI